MAEGGGNPNHDAKGQFSSGPGGGAAPTELVKVKARAFNGEQIEQKSGLKKLETGAIGEAVVAAYLRAQGMPDVKTLNVGKNNAPIDLVGDHSAIEVKAGTVANSKDAQKWRATIGQPGKEESALLKTMSAEDKKAHNAAKAADIMGRKEAERERLSKQLGVDIKAVTIAVILDHDKKTADLYRFDGFHRLIGWHSAATKAAYVGTFRYG